VPSSKALDSRGYLHVRNSQIFNQSPTCLVFFSASEKKEHHSNCSPPRLPIIDAMRQKSLAVSRSVLCGRGRLCVINVGSVGIFWRILPQEMILMEYCHAPTLVLNANEVF